MTSGQLDDRITIQTLTQTNTEGSLSESYATLATVWAQIMSAKGSEALQAAQVRANRVIRVKIRYRSDVGVKDRVVWMSENYNVVDVDRSARREGYLYLTCEVASGA